jgi:hypothetical protein
MSEGASRLINLAEYPVNQPESCQYQQVLANVQKALARDGCALLKGFLTSAGIDALITEADNAAEFAHSSCNSTNPYFTQDDVSFPVDHPKRHFFERSNAFIPATISPRKGRCAAFKTLLDLMGSFRRVWAKKNSTGTRIHWPM